MRNAFSERSLGVDYLLIVPMEADETIADEKQSGVRNQQCVQSGCSKPASGLESSHTPVRLLC
jgi:hypothetical protein